MEDTKLRNRNVCEEHFRIKMFMNMRKERLVRFAYPTLLKTKYNGKVYDLEKMQDLCETEEFTVDSALDESFDQFLVEDEDNPILNYIIPKPGVVEDEKESVLMLNEQNIDDIPVDFYHEKEPLEDVKPMPSKIILTPVRKKVIKRPVESQGELILAPVSTKRIKILNSTNLMKTVPIDPIEVQSTISTNTTSNLLPIKKPATPEKNPQLQKEKENLEMIKKLTEERDQAILNEQKAKQLLIECQAKATAFESKVKELETKLILAEAPKPKPVKIASHNNATQTDPEPKIVVKASPTAQASTKPGTLSKPQLFNGIKRYLSNAMATLLKMEMFGNSERAWKVDEKKISCEVMRLGKDVYEYFTDEWRIRLPSKSEVSNWLQDNADDEEEDLF